MRKNRPVQYVLRLFSSRSRLIKFGIGTEIVLSLLEHYFSNILSSYEVNTLGTSCIVGGELRTSQHVNGGSVYMGEERFQLLVMLLFLAAAALDFAVHEVVI